MARKSKTSGRETQLNWSKF